MQNLSQFKSRIQNKYEISRKIVIQSGFVQISELSIQIFNFFFFSNLKAKQWSLCKIQHGSLQSLGKLVKFGLDLKALENQQNCSFAIKWSNWSCSLNLLSITLHHQLTGVSMFQAFKSVLMTHWKTWHWGQHDFQHKQKKQPFAGYNGGQIGAKTSGIASRTYQQCS